MIDVRPYAPGDIMDIDVQAMQTGELGANLFRRLRTRRPGGVSWTVRNRAGAVICCAGILPAWDGMGQAWAAIGKPRRAEWGALVRLARHKIDRHAPRRLQAQAMLAHGGACRLLEKLGFVCETPDGMACYRGGDAYALYARIRP